jgi:hypothetical protein
MCHTIEFVFNSDDHHDSQDDRDNTGPAIWTTHGQL